MTRQYSNRSMAALGWGGGSDGGVGAALAGGELLEEPSSLRRISRDVDGGELEVLAFPRYLNSGYAAVETVEVVRDRDVF